MIRAIKISARITDDQNLFDRIDLNSEEMNPWVKLRRELQSLIVVGVTVGDPTIRDVNFPSVELRLHRREVSYSDVDVQTYIFLDDVITQSAADVTQPYATWGHDKDDAGSESGYNLDDESDWDMDPDIVNGNQAAVKNALSAIPTMSLVMDWDDLFSGTPDPGMVAIATILNDLCTEFGVSR